MIDKLLWHKATTSQLIKYPNNLDQLLGSCDIPYHVLQCDEFFGGFQQHFIQEHHDNIVNACLQASWTEFISTYKERAIFWHKLWKDDGSPHSGVLFAVRRKTRWKYDYMLNIIKRNKEYISAKRTSEGLSGTGFWAKIKRTLGHHNTMPNMVDDIEGGSNSAVMFEEKYKSLYNWCII